MVNRGEERVWVQMNVVPRSTGNTNSGTRELTLKCKLKCYFKCYTSELILWFHYDCLSACPRSWQACSSLVLAGKIFAPFFDHKTPGKS